jgi:hypothetical protein
VIEKLGVVAVIVALNLAAFALGRLLRARKRPRRR